MIPMLALMVAAYTITKLIYILNDDKAPGLARVVSTFALGIIPWATYRIFEIGFAVGENISKYTQVFPY